MTTGTVAVLCAALAACASSTPDSPPPTPSYSASSLASTSSSASPTTVPVANSCGASELAKLSVRQKLAQLIVVGVTFALAGILAMLARAKAKLVTGGGS
mgnify:CR=1 FL=1